VGGPVAGSYTSLDACLGYSRTHISRKVKRVILGTCRYLLRSFAYTITVSHESFLPVLFTAATSGLRARKVANLVERRFSTPRTTSSLLNFDLCLVFVAGGP